MKNKDNYPEQVNDPVKVSNNVVPEPKIDVNESADAGIKITPLVPIKRSNWKMDSKQNVSWTTSGLPSKGSYWTSVFLVDMNDKDAVSGSILMSQAKNGDTNLTYNVGIINIGGDALGGVQTGTYRVEYRVYKDEEKGPTLGYGKLITTAEGGVVVITD